MNVQVPLRAHVALHLDGLERHVLLGVEPHLLVVGLVGGGAALLRELALIFGELLLLLGVDALFLRGRLDALVEDRIRRVGASSETSRILTGTPVSLMIVSR